LEFTAGKRQIFLHPTTVPWKISFQSAPSSHSSVKSSILWSEEAMCSISTTILKRLAESNLKVISADSVLSLVLQYVFSSELSTFDGENSSPMESEVAADAFSARHPQTCCGVKHLFHGAFLHPLHESIRAYPGEDSEGMSHCRQQRNNKCSKVLPATLHGCPLPDGKTTPMDIFTSAGYQISLPACFMASLLPRSSSELEIRLANCPSSTFWDFSNLFHIQQCLRDDASFACPA